MLSGKLLEQQQSHRSLAEILGVKMLRPLYVSDECSEV